MPTGMKILVTSALFVAACSVTLSQEPCLGEDYLQARRGLNSLAWEVYWRTGVGLEVPERVDVLHLKSKTYEGSCFATLRKCILFESFGAGSSMQPISIDLVAAPDLGLTSMAESFIKKSIKSIHGKVMLVPGEVSSDNSSAKFRNGERIVDVPIASQGRESAIEIENFRFRICKCDRLSTGWARPDRLRTFSLPDSLDSIVVMFEKFYSERKKANNQRTSIRIMIPWFSELDHTLYVLVEGDGNSKVAVCERTSERSWRVQRGFDGMYDKSGFQRISQTIKKLRMKQIVID